MQHNNSRDWLDAENAALIALAESCEKPDTWSSLTNECIIEGSAVRVLEHKIDPENNPLNGQEYVSADTQGTLFQLDDLPSADYAVKASAAWEHATQQVAQWRNHGLDLVTVFDDRFPSRLRSVVDTPPFLFAKGTLLADDSGVSVVGSRKCSPEGARFARDVAHMLCGRGLTVIAGLADGIDSFAHQEALRSGGRTVAFIGTGINRCYPASNRELQHRIEEQGLVLSQFWPDSPPTKQTFPMRNALMSGYGLATVVVEASEHSGTRIQARQAQRHGRPLIFRDTVMEQARWARQYRDKPGVFIVRSVEEVGDALDMIAHIDNGADALLDDILTARVQYA
ncbi:DNA-processing protein DprA [Bifidobacterium catulorum]|uniref:DNA-processing protein DprA n=1 Tax=Bifidobacterium catulorum TaxID=1630173 RepID=A0A2U2MRU6_9BIFI|nr:DNA-processing protein DprA [Bifidobacterium catulorum]PWG59571.1 DNA-processing protein DprA [Bifidobacterium catulorum]